MAEIAQMPFVHDFVIGQVAALDSGTTTPEEAQQLQRSNAAEVQLSASAKQPNLVEPDTLEHLLELFDLLDDEDSGFVSRDSLRSKVTERLPGNPQFEQLVILIAAVDELVLEREEFEELVIQWLAARTAAIGEVTAKEVFREMAQDMLDSSDDEE